MKIMQIKLLVATVLVVLNCVNTFGQHVKNKIAGSKEAKVGRMNDASKDVIMHHMSSFQENNLEAVLADYTNESVLITQDATYKGTAEIHDFFVELLKHFPKASSTFKLDKIESSNRLVYIVWHAKSPSMDVTMGTDTFIVKDGKILQQTFAGQMKYIN